MIHPGHFDQGAPGHEVLALMETISKGPAAAEWCDTGADVHLDIISVMMVGTLGCSNLDNVLQRTCMNKGVHGGDLFITVKRFVIGLL